jgi:hypothetical protein
MVKSHRCILAKVEGGEIRTISPSIRLPLLSAERLEAPVVPKAEIISALPHRPSSNPLTRDGAGIG